MSTDDVEPGVAVLATAEHLSTVTSVTDYAEKHFPVLSPETMSGENGWGAAVVVVGPSKSSASYSSVFFTFPWSWHKLILKMRRDQPPRQFWCRDTLIEYATQYVKSPSMLTHAASFIHAMNEAKSSDDCCTVEWATKIASVSGWCIGPQLRASLDTARFKPAFILNPADRARALIQDEQPTITLQVGFAAAPLYPRNPVSSSLPCTSPLPFCSCSCVSWPSGPPLGEVCSVCFPPLYPTPRCPMHSPAAPAPTPAKWAVLSGLVAQPPPCNTTLTLPSPSPRPVLTSTSLPRNSTPLASRSPNTPIPALASSWVSMPKASEARCGTWCAIGLKAPLPPQYGTAPMDHQSSSSKDSGKAASSARSCTVPS